ncbi:hypothetical protein ACU8M5_10445 [Rhizobium leguminosarum]
MDRNTLEITERSTKAQTRPRKGRSVTAPSEARAVAIQMVNQLSTTHKPAAIRSAIARKVSRINEDRSFDYRVRKPSGRLVKHLLLEHRRRSAIAASTPMPKPRPEEIERA